MSYYSAKRRRVQCLATCDIDMSTVKIFEYTKGVIRSRKGRKCNGQKTKDKQRSTKYYTENIEQHEPDYKPGVNSGAPEG